MIEPEETRKEPYLVETWQREPARNDLTINEAHGQEVRETRTRAVGSPLPTGTARSIPEAGYRAVPPQGRSLTGGSPEDTGMQRAMGMLKQAMPFVQKLLPLIDGNFATAVANLFAPRPHMTSPQAPLDLAPVHTQITELQTHTQDLRTQMPPGIHGSAHLMIRNEDHRRQCGKEFFPTSNCFFPLLQST